MDILSSNLFELGLLMEQGGIVLWSILLASVLMWALIIERYYFVYFVYPRQAEIYVDAWQQRSDRRSWCSQQIRAGMIAHSRYELQRHIVPIKTLTGVLPMLGLLGTVYGMIQTFDVMTVFGTGNTRGMASGISIALITTMGGLMTALSGMYFITQLQQQVSRRVDNLAAALRRY